MADWDARWMGAADYFSSWSKCDGAKVGMVLTDETERYLVGIGYNGAPAGFPEESGATCTSFCPRARGEGERSTSYSNCPSVHAEVNGILSSERGRYAGGTAYVTRACCWDCSKVLANSGVKRVVMRVTDDDWHRDPDKSIDLLRECGVLVDVYERGRAVPS